MRKYLLAIPALALLFTGASCTPEENVSKCPEGAVDLGIVMTREDGTTYNLYWAKSNLSISGLCANPEDWGDFYAWGETEPYYSNQNPLTWKDGKTGYDLVSYKFWTSGDSYENLKFSKYNTQESFGPVDNITELQRGEKSGETVDDAARATLGRKWRMPTEAEWTALRTQCTWTWITQNGVNGRLVTASNGNSIFLPASGFRYDTDICNSGSVGYYWSSSLCTEYPDTALGVYLYSEYVSNYNPRRNEGQCVRPVSE